MIEQAIILSQSATNLTLKFIVHFGYIKEIKVAQFVKATGIDMIVAHRLLTEPCCNAAGLNNCHPVLSWSKSSYAYTAVGNIKFEFATLTGYKSGIPSALQGVIGYRKETMERGKWQIIKGGK